MTPLLAQRQRADRAFERIYRRHVGDVYRYTLAVMRNEQDAEDVTQTTFMNAYRAFQRGERPAKAQNWLIAIAHNVCRQRFRQSARRPLEVSFDDDVGATLVDAEDAPSGEDIRRALGHLAFNQRAALVMRELEGRSYAEIAEILDLSTSAVETLIFRARRALREQLESSLTCGEAELAISKQLDGRLPRSEKAALRAHLRECAECSTFARRQRAQRTALRSLAAVPLPSSLASFFGGGGATVGSGVAVKAAVALTAGVAIGGAGYAGIHDVVKADHGAKPAPATRTHATSGRTSHQKSHQPQILARRQHQAHGHLASRPAAGSPRLVGRSAHNRHVHARNIHAASARGRVRARPVHVAHTHATYSRPVHVYRSHRPASPAGRVKPHHVVRSKPVSHSSPPPQAASGGAKGNGHGK
jgi:RNA polymerase sigma factor (sigma-70 family)